MPQDTTAGEKWFIAIVTPNTEKKSAEKLGSLYAELASTYVPIQEETHYWASIRKRKKVERVVCPCYLFVRCTEPARKTIKSDKRCTFILHFMKDRGRKDENGIAQFAVIPDRQMEAFRKMVEGKREVCIESRRLIAGTRVRINLGDLEGLEGYLLRDARGSSKLCVRIDNVGFASMEISLDEVEVIDAQTP